MYGLRFRISGLGLIGCRIEGLGFGVRGKNRVGVPSDSAPGSIVKGECSKLRGLSNPKALNPKPLNPNP